MTVSSSTSRVQFNGNGSTTVFAYSFKIFDQDDLTVIVRSATGTETVKTITTHYTVSGVGNAGGGNVTMLTAPASGETLTILREQDLVQELDLVENDPFPAQSLEDALDKLTFIVQQHDEELGRSIKASRTNTIGSTEFTVLAADRANKVFAFNSAGELSVAQELGTYRGNWATSTAFAERDIVKDTSNNNIYICVTAHTSTGSQPISSNADVAKWALLVDAASATTSASAAASSASAAATSATNAGNSATAAAGSASAASSSASTATTQASNASSSASAAATSATNASNSATAAAGSASSASSSASTATTQASNASTSASAASSSASAASTSATNAATSATNASNSASAASTSATNASNSATAAASSASAASTSATNAAASAAAAAASFDAFDDIYLGSKSSDPSVDNDGNALTTGDQYFNSVANELRVWNGSTWQAASTVGGTVASLSVTGDVTITDKIIHAGDTNTAIRFPAADTVTVETSGAERLRVDSSGNVGIGTTSPRSRLDVVSSASDSVLNLDGANVGGSAFINFRTSGTNRAYVGLGALTGGSNNDLVSWVSGAANSIFYTNSTERMRIDASGNLGLGVTPSAWGTGVMLGLQIGSAGAIAGDVGAGYRTRLFGNAYYDGSAYKYIASAAAVMQVANGNNGTFEWHNASTGTAGNAITFTQAMTLNASGNLGIGLTSPNYKVHASSYLASTAQGTTSLFGSDSGGTFVGNTSAIAPVYFWTNGAERARIDSSGNLLVGTTSVASIPNAGWYFAPGGFAKAGNTNGVTGFRFIEFGRNGGAIGGIDQNGTTAVAYTTSSDYRLKENVQPMQDALAVIAQLNPVTYTWKADGSDGQGFIAHELQAVVPDCVTGEKDAVDAEGNPQYQGVDTSFLVATLVKAVQELKAEVDSLRAQLTP